MTVCACLARRRPGRALVTATLVCGFAVMVLTVGTFSAVNAAVVDAAALGGWLAAGVAANLAILFGANVLLRKRVA